jgi:hypothetical protein
MRKRRVLTIVLGDNWAEFAGPNVRALYVSLVGRPPVYNTRTRRWVTVPKRARDLVALAESRGYDVVVTASEAA